MRDILRFRNYRHFKGGIYSVIGVSVPLQGNYPLNVFEDTGLKCKTIIAKHTESDKLTITHHGSCLHSEFLYHRESKCKDKLVVYVSLIDGLVYCRPYDMFVEKLDKRKYPGYSSKYRFELITNISNLGNKEVEFKCE